MSEKSFELNPEVKDNMSNTYNSFNFICCGSVDDGKSSLIGQMLLNLNAVKKDIYDEALNYSFDHGSCVLEPGLLLDGLIEERNQQITIDIAHRYFDYKNTRYHIFDCPGHEQYTRNMAIAAAEADMAILVIDVLKGISPQTKKHLSICALLQIKYLIITLSKCDLTKGEADSWDEVLINERRKEIEDLLGQYNFTYSVICVDSIHNVNVSQVIDKIEQYKDEFHNNKVQHFIMPVYSAKFINNNRYYWGKLLDKKDIHAGEKLKLFPINKEVMVKADSDNGVLQIMEDFDIQTGNVFSDINLYVGKTIKHRTFWFSEPTKEMILRHGVSYCNIINYTDSVLALDKEICFNNINEVKQNGFGIIIDKHTKKTLALSVFLANTDLIDVQKKGYVYWFTGLSGAGKTTLAKHLWDKFSIKPILLDADDVRKTINSDLTHTKEDCLENVRRIANIAQLLSSQGFNVIVTCISKYKDQRQNIKELLNPYLIEILVDRDFKSLKENDVKGLYKSLGSANMIKDYEYGNSVDIIIDTENFSEQENTEYLFRKLKEKGVL